MDALPLIANNLGMVHSISRHYARPAALAAFLRKVANQLAARCRAHLLAPGKLWDQDKAALVEALGACTRLHAAFSEHATRLLQGGRGRGGAGGATPAAGAAAAEAEAAAEQALAKYGLFAKRCSKLAELFTTVHQFAQLAQHTHIEGVGAVLAKFGEVGRERRCWVVSGACTWRLQQLQR